MQSTIETFRALESDGQVRLRALPETESYFDVYGEPDSPEERQEIIDQIERTGCWFVVSEYLADGEWHHADSVGMCAGYENPLDPAENSYIEDLMRAAIRALEMQSTEGASDPMTLHSYIDGSYLRLATDDEARESEEQAKRDGGAGVILVEIDGKPMRCYVEP